MDWCGADTRLLREARLDSDACECIADGDDVFGNPYDVPVQLRINIVKRYHNLGKLGTYNNKKTRYRTSDSMQPSRFNILLLLS